MTIALSGRQLLQTQSAPPIAGYLPAWAIWQRLCRSALGWIGLLLVDLSWLWRHATTPDWG
ncbi:MAG: hypothetical protein R3E79_47615 [Caldilineaceae bacterium]